MSDSAMSRFLLVVAALLGKNRAMYASQVKQMFYGRSAREEKKIIKNCFCEIDFHKKEIIWQICLKSIKVILTCMMN